MNADLKACTLIVAAVLAFVRAVAAVRGDDVAGSAGWLGVSLFVTTFAWDASELAFT